MSLAESQPNDSTDKAAVPAFNPAEDAAYRRRRRCRPSTRRSRPSRMSFIFPLQLDFSTFPRSLALPAAKHTPPRLPKTPSSANLSYQRRNQCGALLLSQALSRLSARLDAAGSFGDDGCASGGRRWWGGWRVCWMRWRGAWRAGGGGGVERKESTSEDRSAPGSLLPSPAAVPRCPPQRFGARHH
ncbi:hypothetical protein B0H14DRAFT_163865 [Mycena olivaceomarginata]|nr:hypothetical protein B0H14DRAFT_163865 [Mycena olivaceomarginata]